MKFSRPIGFAHFISAVALIATVLTSSVGLADAREIFVLITRTIDDDAAQRDAEGNLANIVSTILKQEIREYEIKNISYRNLKREYISLDNFIQTKKPTNYVHVEVFGAGVGGLTFEMEFQADNLIFKKSLLFGPRAMENWQKTATKLRPYLIVYKAMIAGYPAENVVFVNCFDNYLLNDATTRRNVTLTLPSRLRLASLKSRKYWTYGVSQRRFMALCGETNKEEPADQAASNYVIHGSIYKAQESNNSGKVDIYLDIWIKEPSSGDEEFFQYGRLSSVDKFTAPNDLASCIAQKWGKWDLDPWNC